MITIYIDKDEDNIKACGPTCIALGNFDGVHIGHAALIRKTLQYAEERGLCGAVWSFDGYSGKKRNEKIVTDERRCEIIGGMGVQYLFLNDFDKVCTYSCEEFVKKVLIDRCDADTVFCGYNFRFGSGASGDAETLKRLMSEYGKHTVILPEVCSDGQTVSSSRIRTLVKQGDMPSAAKLLGRPYFIDTDVVHGKHLGRTIGSPTINQNFPEGQLVPAHGVYACTVTVDGEKYRGCANIGVRPSVENGAAVNCETHIIDYDKDLYGRRIKVEFYKYLRGEMKFPDVDALRAAIAIDVQNTKEYFESI